jgi:outer membrane protein assembly factor BamA
VFRLYLRDRLPKKPVTTISLAGIALVLLICLYRAAPAEARDTLTTERAIGDLLTSRARGEAESPLEDSGEWGLLPQVGFSPDQGIKVGIKYTARHVRGTGLTLDLNAIGAQKGQQSYTLTGLHSRLFDGHLIVGGQATFSSDPTHEFFGLGNNDVGPDPLSTHRVQTIGGTLTLAWRAFDRLAIMLSAGYRDVQIGRGKADEDHNAPFTVDVFPELTGIDGGHTIPLTLSLIFNNREDITRPTQGWSLIAEVEHVDRSLGSDFEFTRFSVDASYLWPILKRRQILAIRLGGKHILGDQNDIPFYELAHLGGDNTLRGFFQDRFLGKSLVLATLEYRFKIVDFPFFDLWQVRIDGVAFGETGRVFIDADDVEDQLSLDEEFVSRLIDNFKYSYGGGIRIALGKAILARIDVGFSDEETALVYLTFSHTF